MVYKSWIIIYLSEAMQKLFMLNYIYQTRKLIQLAAPVFIGQLSQVLMGFVDTVMAGGVGNADMAAVSFGGSFWVPAVILVIGMLLPVTSMVSCHFGAGNYKAIPPLIWSSFYLGLIFSVLVMCVLYNLDYLFYRMELDSNMRELSIIYLKGILWGVPAVSLLQSLRACVEGISYTVPVMIVSIIGLIFNIILNYIFINGYLGAPALGGAGCGVATAIVCWIMLLFMLIYIMRHRRFAEINLFEKFRGFNSESVSRLFFIGAPVALSNFFEVSLFSAIIISISHLGTDVVASNQIASSVSSIVFMLPVSIGIAVSIRVGYYLGLKDPAMAHFSSKTGILVTFFLSILTCLSTFLFRSEIADVYSDSMNVVSFASEILMLSALYQVSDGLQVVCAGALRGYGDTKTCFFVALISYWFIAYPLGYALSMTDLILTEPMGVKGFWVAVIVGLSCASLLFFARLSNLQKKYSVGVF